MVRTSLHEFYVMTMKISPPELFYVMADHMNYPENVGFLSVILDAQRIT